MLGWQFPSQGCLNLYNRGNWTPLGASRAGCLSDRMGAPDEVPGHDRGRCCGACLACWAGMPSLRCDTLSERDSMFVILWQFDIAEEKLSAFEAAYGSQGKWATLFARSTDYLGTELLKDAYVPGRYVTIDRWTSEDAFRAFRAQYDQDYEAIDRACDSLTAAETRIGAF